VEDAARLMPGARAVEVPLAPREAYPVFLREAAQVHEPLWRDHRELYGTNVAAKLEKALLVTDAEFESAQRARGLYREQIAEAMEGLDLLVTPTLPSVAPQSGLGDLALRGSLIKLTLPWNTVGAPALAMPCGSAEDGLPASIQLVGAPGADALVLGAGRALEQRLR
jgi:aspartyl-tRNA(Asn)/glutamyl-tRNA(Gln) amidotransferase subunit A